jgi:hypothetical protein
MKRFNSILACGLVLAVAGLAIFTTSVKAAAGKREAKASVRAVHGLANYSTDNGATWMTLRPNTELGEGAMIKTDPDAVVDLQVNGRTSTVRVTAGTTMTLKQMDTMGSIISPDTETQLDMANGLVVGSVKKISGDSTYRVSTPRGVAGIRGTDFAVQVTAQANGTYSVTFTSVSGAIVCVSNISINGTTTPVTKILTTGQSWTPPDVSTSVEAALFTGLSGVARDIIKILAEMNILPPTPVQAPGPIIFHAPNPSPSNIGGVRP